MNLLVLGGTVFIGLRLVKLLHEQGHNVTVLNRGISEAVLPTGVKRIIVDRMDASGVNDAIGNASFDGVFDISCYTPEALTPVIAALNGNVGHFIFCSTTSVYQTSNVSPITEEFPLDRGVDASDYAGNKIVCEDMLMQSVADYGFPATILRPPYVYGPHNKIIQREFSFFARLLHGCQIIVPGDGLALFQPVHVDDLAAAFANALGKTQTVGQIYTVSGPQAITINGYIETIGEIVGVAPETLYIADIEFDKLVKQLDVAEQDLFPFEWRVSNIYSIDKAVRDLDWNPKYEMHGGLEMTYAWWKENRCNEEWDFSVIDQAIQSIK